MSARFIDPDTTPDRRRFLAAVAELRQRFALEVHAFVLMADLIIHSCGPQRPI
jgi:hypothetical protein